MTMQASVLPNLEIGVETPWPALRGGKQVYARLIDFGGFPAPYGLRAKTHDVRDIEWGQISWDYSYVSSSTDGRRRSLALVSTPETSGGNMPWRFLVDSTSVQVNMLTNIDYREWDTIVLCLLYTRTGEGEESGSMVKPGPEGTVLTSREGGLAWEEKASCRCEVATPERSGLVLDGGRPGQVFGVNDEGTAYGFLSPAVTGTLLTESSVYVAPYTGFYIIRCQGGGGAGGMIHNSTNSSKTLMACGGGASGGFQEALVYLVKGQNVDCTIGAGGDNSAGGNTVFGEYLTAEGGARGGSIGNVGSYQQRGGGRSGLGGVPGGDGQIVVFTSSLVPYSARSGMGASSRYGHGGTYVQVDNTSKAATGADAVGHGAGGSGAALSNKVASDVLGGKGSPGCIEITMFGLMTEELWLAWRQRISQAFYSAYQTSADAIYLRDQPVRGVT